MADDASLGSLTGSLEIDDKLTDTLTDAARQVAEFAGAFDGAMGIVIGAAGAAAAAIAGLTATIVALAEKGSTIQGVTEAFDRLAEHAGTSGEVLRENFSAGLQGTVDQMAIMQSTTRLLGAGMDLTANQALMMGDAARALGKATGTDAAQGLEMMSSALATGRTRQLQMQIGLIDTKAGEEEFAKSIGTTADQLNAEGQLEGKRLAILEATQAYLARVGDSELTFKERVQQSVTAVEEWVDTLAQTIAQSPVVNRALESVQEAIAAIFNDQQKTLMDSIVAGINAFATAVEFAGNLVKAASPYIKDFWGLLKNIAGIEWTNFKGGVDTLDYMILRFKGYSDQAAQAQVAQDKLNAATQRAQQQATDWWAHAPEVGTTGIGAAPGKDPSKFTKDNAQKAQAATEASIAQTEQLWDQYYQTLDKMDGDSLEAKIAADDRWYESEQAKLAKTVKLNSNYNEQDYAISQLYLAKKAADEAAFSAKQVDVLAKLHEQTMAAEAKLQDNTLEVKLAGLNQQEQAEELSYQKQYDAGTISASTLEQAVAEIKAKYRAEDLSAEKVQADKVAQQVLAGFNQIQSARQSYDDFVAQSTQTSLSYQEEKIQEWADAQKKAFKGTEEERAAFDQIIEAHAQAQIDALTIDNKALVDNSWEALQDIADKNYNTWQAMVADPDNYSAHTIAQFHQIYLKSQEAADGVQSTWMDTFDSIAKQIPTIIQNAFTGSGGGIGALKAVGSMVGSEVGKQLVSSMQDTLDNMANSGSKFLAGLGDLISSAIPVIGAALGPLIGGVVNHFFGTQGRDAVVAFAQTFGGFDQLHAKLDALGAAGEQMWIKLTQQTGRNDLAAAQATIAQINQLLNQQQTDTQNVAAAMQKYGLTWEMAGGQAEQSHLDTIAQGLVKDFADLTNAGFGVDVITQHMSSSIDDYIHEAERTGSEVPEAMEPLLQKMIDMGTLTDNNGNKITDMSQLGVTFSETMTEGFKSIVDAVNTLTQALTGSSPNSLKNSLDTIGNTVVHPKIQPTYDGSGIPSNLSPSVPGGPSDMQQPTSSATLPATGGSAAYASSSSRSSNAVTVPITFQVGNEVLAKQMIKTFVRAGFGT